MPMTIHEPAAAPAPISAPPAVTLPERLRDRAADLPRPPSNDPHMPDAVDAALAGVLNGHAPPAPLLSLLSMTRPAVAMAAGVPLARQLLQVTTGVQPAVPGSPPLQAATGMANSDARGTPAGTGGAAPQAQAVPAPAAAAQPVPAALSVGLATTAGQGGPAAGAELPAVAQPAVPAPAARAGATPAQGPHAGSVNAPVAAAPVQPTGTPAPAALPEAGAASKDRERNAAPPTPSPPAAPLRDDAGTPLAQNPSQAQDASQQTHRLQARVRAQQAAQATAQAARSAASATRLDVAFNSWGAGHAVVAHVEHGRVQLQPSSRQVADGLAGALALGEDAVVLPIGASDAAEDSTDQRRRRHQRQPGA